MPLHVLGHIEANQLDAEDECQLLGDLGLAHAGRTGEKERADGLVCFSETGARHLDRSRQCFNCRVLTEHDIFQVTINGLQLRTIVLVNRLRRDTRDLGNDVLDLGLANGFLLFGFWQNALRCARLVNHINRFVRQMTIIDEPRSELGRCGQRQC